MLEYSPESLESPSFRRCEIVRQMEGPQLIEESPEAFDPTLEINCPGAEDGSLSGPQSPQRILEQGSPVRLIRHAIGRDEGDGVRRFHVVLLDGIEDVLLSTFRERRERIPQGWTDAPSRESVLPLHRETRRQLQSPRHPGPLASQERGDSARRHLVVLNERLDDPGFIQGSEGPRGSIGEEQEPLHRGKTSRRWNFDDRWDRLVSGLPPRLDALEPVDDLVVTIVGHHHPDGQDRQGRRGTTELPGTQRSQALANLLERQLDPRPGHIIPATGPFSGRRIGDVCGGQYHPGSWSRSGDPIDGPSCGRYPTTLSWFSPLQLS